VRGGRAFSHVYAGWAFSQPFYKQGLYRQLNDLGGTPGFGGSLERALGAIKAKVTVMAGQTDLYFTPADIEADAAGIPGARFRVIPSLGGHMAGASLHPTDCHFIETEIKALLAA
jgi:homoserine O-acetyltransferase/O-succinyltransferase